MRQEAAALREFSPTYVRFGSFSSDRRAPDARGLSASLRKRTCANSPRYVRLVRQEGALLDPELVRVTVKVIVSPTFGAGFDTDLVIVRFPCACAACGLKTAARRLRTARRCRRARGRPIRCALRSAAPWSVYRRVHKPQHRFQ